MWILIEIKFDYNGTIKCEIRLAFESKPKLSEADKGEPKLISAETVNNKIK